MTDHTPGPWVVTDLLDLVAIRQLGGPTLAVVYRKPGLPAVTNARLMAIAPELLALCQAIHAWFDDYVNQGALWPEEARQLFRQLTTAIASATGEGAS